MNALINERSLVFEHYRENPEVSVLIVGAGVNGIGLFRDLALNGVDVLLVDRVDFCSGASAASSHMAHGGIRYLENGEFRLVREAVQERNRLLQNAPHFVKPLATTIPIFKMFSGLLNAPLKFFGWLNKPSERGALVIKLGLMLYDAYTGASGAVPSHRLRSGSSVHQDHPALHPDVRYLATYFDGAILQPERLCLEMILDAEAAAASCRAINYLGLSGVEGEWVMLQETEGERRLRVKPKLVVNAAGPWIDAANLSLGISGQRMGGTKGSHLILDHPELRVAVGENEFFFENSDGRIVLVNPYFDKVMIGTSDLPIDDPDLAVCTDAEVDYFFEMVARVFPGIQLDRAQIVFQFSGVRPLPASQANTTGQISRDHSIDVIESGDQAFPVLCLIGGKWTTFRAFAEQAADQVLDRLGRTRRQSTQNLPIGGGLDFPEVPQVWATQEAHTLGLAPNQAITQLSRYGTRVRAIFGQTGSTHAGLSGHDQWTQTEIDFILLNEKVVHLDDLILRRTLMAMLGDVTLDLLQELAERMAAARGWDLDQQAAELTRCRAILDRKHGVTL